MISNETMRTAGSVKFAHVAGQRAEGVTGDVLTSCGKTSTSKEAGDDTIPHVLLLPVALNGTVERREHPTPDTEVTTGNWCTSLDDREGTDEPITLQQGELVRRRYISY